MDRNDINRVLVITTTATIELECPCGGKYIRVYGKVDSKTGRNMYRCDRCKKAVYLNADYNSIKLESMSNRHIIGTESVYIDKPYTCDCGGMILYIGDKPGRCIKCNKTYEV